VSVLGRKLGRDLLRLKGQVVTISLVLACGVMAMVMLRSTWSSLERSRDAYYAAERFADVFAALERAPDAVAARLERIPGVARVYPRVVKEVLVPLPDEPDPVTGRIVSLPSDGSPPPLCGVVLRAGRWPATGVADEVVVLEAFATARGLRPGDSLPAVLNGSVRTLRIVGTGMSPEYLFAIGAGQSVADDRRFAILWMLRAQVAPAFQLEGAFDDVAIALQPGARPAAVLAELDRELQAYGGRHAVGRDHQLSNLNLTAELEQLQNLALMIPMAFLLVAAFLVNVVVSRLVYLERTQIAVLKALGRRDRQIALHYLGFVGVTVVLGGLLGTGLGIWAGRWMTDLYTSFFKFPSRVFTVPPALIAGTVAVAGAAAVAGALGAVRRVAALPPAQAMRPPTPPSYHRSLGVVGRVVGPSAMMIVREIARRPARFLMSAAGIAMGVAIFILGRFSWDSWDRLLTEQFTRAHREDLAVTLVASRPERAVRELAHLPGVLSAEGVRTLPVRYRAGHRWRDAALFGVPAGSELRHIIDSAGHEVPLPDGGLVLIDRLAALLGVGAGDRVDVEVLEGKWRTRAFTVAAVVDEPLGLQGYARADWLAAALGEEPRVDQVLLRIEAPRLADVQARLKAMPAVIGTSSVHDMIKRYNEQTGRSIGVITLILTLSAGAIAIGVVYNNARIALSMRSRDLASLRVLGFTRAEISTILLGELTAQVLLGVVAGLALGWVWARVYAGAIHTDYMRFPFFIAATTYGLAAVIALASGLASALLVRRRLDRLDLIAVLKATE
jgi:putative ABC transport system permease protein